MPTALSSPIVLDRSWWSWTGPHGGHVAGHLARAATRLPEVAGRPLRSLAVSFLRALPEGPADVTAELVRSGRSTSVVDTAVLTADGRPGVTGRAVLGPPATGPSYDRAAAAVPPPEDLPPLVMPEEMLSFARFSGNVDFRPVSTPPFSGAGDPDLLAWARMRDGRPVDVAVSAFLVDAMPPALFGLLDGPAAVPTVDLTVSWLADLDAEPVDDWVLLRITTRRAADGWCVDDSEVRARDGRLLALGRQTRLVLS
jgi:acyl-CoA thioesterase